MSKLILQASFDGNKLLSDLKCDANYLLDGIIDYNVVVDIEDVNIIVDIRLDDKLLETHNYNYDDYINMKFVNEGEYKCDYVGNGECEYPNEVDCSKCSSNDSVKNTIVYNG